MCVVASDQPLPYLTEFALSELAPGPPLVWLPGFIGPYPSTSLDKSLVAIQLSSLMEYIMCAADCQGV